MLHFAYMGFTNPQRISTFYLFPLNHMYMFLELYAEGKKILPSSDCSAFV